MVIVTYCYHIWHTYGSYGDVIPRNHDFWNIFSESFRGDPTDWGDGLPAPPGDGGGIHVEPRPYMLFYVVHMHMQNKSEHIQIALQKASLETVKNCSGIQQLVFAHGSEK